jgi:hypothetical protein
VIWLVTVVSGGGGGVGGLTPGAGAGVGPSSLRWTADAHHAVGRFVGLALVDIARRADPALELHAAALLHDVRGLVRDRMQVGAIEHDVVSRRVRLGAHRLRARRRVGAGVPLHARDAVPAEQPLDGLTVRQRRRRGRDAALCAVVDRRGVRRVALELHARQRLGQRALAGRLARRLVILTRGCRPLALDVVHRPSSARPPNLVAVLHFAGSWRSRPTHSPRP